MQFICEIETLNSFIWYNNNISSNNNNNNRYIKIHRLKNPQQQKRSFWYKLHFGTLFDGLQL
jgi:hypothetical protein